MPLLAFGNFIDNYRMIDFIRNQEEPGLAVNAHKAFIITRCRCLIKISYQ